MAGTSDEYVEVGASADSEDYQAFLDDYSNQFTPTEGGEALHARENLEKIAAEGTPITGRVLEKIKGGLTVDIGIVAFLPSSQVEVRPIHNLDAYVGRDLEVRLLKLNRRRGNAVVSRRVLLEHDLQARKAEALAGIEEGGVVTGVIKNLTDYGAFV